MTSAPPQSIANTVPSGYSASGIYFSAKSAYCALVATPLNVVAPTVPFVLLYVNTLSVFAPKLPVAAVTKVGKHVASAPSSATVIVVAIAAVPVVSSFCSASVPAVLGNTTSTSAVLAAPTSVTPFVPLSVPSKNLILPPTVVLVALIIGFVSVLSVNVSVQGGAIFG